MTDLRQRVHRRLSELREWRERMMVEWAGQRLWVRRVSTDGHGHQALILQHRKGAVRVDLGDCLICLDDPATVGILAGLVRQRAPDADLHTGVITAHRRAGLSPGDSAGLAYLAVTEAEVEP